MQNERVCLWLGCSTVHFNIYVLNVRDKWCLKASSMPSPGRVAAVLICWAFSWF